MFSDNGGPEGTVLDAAGSGWPDRRHARLYGIVCAASEFVSQALPGIAWRQPRRPGAMKTARPPFALLAALPLPAVSNTGSPVSTPILISSSPPFWGRPSTGSPGMLSRQRQRPAIPTPATRSPFPRHGRAHSISSSEARSSNAFSEPKLIEMFSTCKRQELAVFNRDISDLEYASELPA